MKHVKTLAALMLTVLTMALVLSFTAMTACAAEEPAQAVTLDMQEDGILTMEAPTVTIAAANGSLVPLAAAANGGQQQQGGANDAGSSYTTVMNFFITWIRRIGAAVALIGAIMFGLAIKDNNADQKQAGLMTMVAGFIVVAICLAANMFDLFS
ncbi:MAG: hypothetical protein IKN55_06450 [Oscillospiraceae bacterium]|nr:hypothetical protein [Oscillospiraceae bacterium]